MVDIPSMSLVIPAFNEEGYLAETLAHVRTAERFLVSRTGSGLQVVVVDNGSNDRTAAIAREMAAVVVAETEHNIARVRNAGAQVADGEVLVFLDADTLVPVELFVRIAEEMTTDRIGGSVDVLHRPGKSPVLRAYFRMWRFVGLLGGMAQGACQFCRRDVFAALGGYDETIYMGEDIDFYWRLRGLARRRHARTCFIRDLQVIPSTRRFDQWSVWRTLLFTNPLLIPLLGRRRKTAWSEWYDRPPR
jgi:glycosyltransferase involved in cell wall biosynthesis